MVGSVTPGQKEGYELLHDGIQVLSCVASQGVRVDREYLSEVMQSTKHDIHELETELQSDSLWADWRDVFGKRSKLSARVQLAQVLFEELGYESKYRTAKGRVKADAMALELIDLPFVKKWLLVEKKKKTLSFLVGIEREIGCDGRVHASYSLNIARSYRSSSFHPNSQNWPIRDPEMGSAIRRCFVAEPGCVIAEVDYGQVEVRVAACYNRDPVLIEYICDPSKDMHRDVAAECFLCSGNQVTKYLRYCGKNGFVFPEFYGSFFRDCAANLWNMVSDQNLADGTPLVEHLRAKGVWCAERGDVLGDAVSRYENGSIVSYRDHGPARESGRGRIVTTGFFEHIRQVEQRFWGRRFRVYAEWKERWYKEFLRRGYYDTLTGFRVGGMMSRNDVINYGIQGSAFHCLLWSLIRIMRELERRGMRSRIIGQIHDSIIAEVPVDEVRRFLRICKRIMVRDIRRHWSWITVPLEVDAEVAPEGMSWYDKKEVQIDE